MSMNLYLLSIFDAGLAIISPFQDLPFPLAGIFPVIEKRKVTKNCDPEFGVAASYRFRGFGGKIQHEKMKENRSKYQN